ncbi:conserved membrane hypothetical protein [Flavobacterium sp. 9AF]|uniref:hypothetical protein n=1 Tax=Flavobacterium sp. 9AF TaxID=2653142 RepID=UPI0012F1FDE6|nr:hypothetical protein [Flavobacterium sp. 9AF]VXA99645.1 conserved membrane hypothetical protein [Flavobacterium sp. 9AF]
MSAYFWLQFTIYNRKLKEFGVPPILAYFLLGIIFFYFSKLLFEKVEYGSYLYAFFPIILVVQSSEVNKNDFLRLIFSRKIFYMIKLIENLIITLPFLLGLLYFKLYLIATTLLILIVALVFVSFRKTYQITIKTPFSKHPFEFCIGFRKNILIFIGCYFLAYMGIEVSNFNLTLFSLFATQLTCLSFYFLPEDIFYVWMYSFNPKEFIRYKFKVAVAYSSILTFPIFISTLIFFPEEIWIVLGVMILNVVIMLAGIIAKYAAYPDKISIRETILLLFIVWLPPLLLFVIPYLYSRSLKKLKTILHDSDN